MLDVRDLRQAENDMRAKGHCTLAVSAVEQYLLVGSVSAGGALGKA